LGFSPTDAVVIATAISELARNIVQYARAGEILIRAVREGVREGIVVVARDDGPGIADVEQAMQDGYSTGGGLGFGLPGVKRLMDNFDIESRPGAGTTVTVAKWRS
ncbi:MAG: ATP-binding protein, partial [Bacillota bacterium]